MPQPSADSVRLAGARAIDAGRAVSLLWSDGVEARFHALWLLDSQPGPPARDATSGQRLQRVLDLDPDPRVQDSRVSDDGMCLELDLGGRGAPLRFDARWLRRCRYDRPGRQERSPWLAATVRTWNAGTGGVPYTDEHGAVTASRPRLRDWLRAVRRDGVALLRGGPLHEGAVLDVVALFGHVRETGYGRVFQVRDRPQAENLAYTRMGLAPHTDNPYREQQPGLQLLYCLRASEAGGETILVDGFRLVERLRDADAAACACLARYTARFAYAGHAGMRLDARRPMIETATDGELQAVRFNNRSMAPLRDVPYEQMPAYYAAYRQFEALADADDMQVCLRLQPGDCLLVDNRRVLHGRRAFTAAGERWLQGCYADREELLSRLSVLEETR